MKISFYFKGHTPMSFSTSLLYFRCGSRTVYKVKVKLSVRFNWVPRHGGVLGRGGIVPRVLDLGTKWRWVISFTVQPLYPEGKSFWCPLNRRLGGLQTRSGRGGEEKNSQPLPGLEPPIIQPVAQRYTTELSRLLRGQYRICFRAHVTIQRLATVVRDSFK
jgi:hypothetical protein